MRKIGTIKLDKKLVDEVIRLTEKYYRSRDPYYLEARAEARYALKEKTTWEEVDLLSDLARYTQSSGRGTYDDIYRALAVFGIIVKELENEE